MADILQKIRQKHLAEFFCPGSGMFKIFLRKKLKHLLLSVLLSFHYTMREPHGCWNSEHTIEQPFEFSLFSLSIIALVSLRLEAEEPRGGNKVLDLLMYIILTCYYSIFMELLSHDIKHQTMFEVLYHHPHVRAQIRCCFQGHVCWLHVMRWPHIRGCPAEPWRIKG